MTPEQVKQANAIVEKIEKLELLLTAVGSTNTDLIKFQRHGTNDLYIDGEMLTRLRSRFEDAINAERLELLKELATKYGVRAVA